MTFSSLTFLFFYLPITIVIMKITPFSYSKVILFIVSLIFYGWEEPIYILLMLLSTIVDYFNGLFIYKYRHKKNIAKGFVIFSIVFNLSMLAFFKYYDFIVLSLQRIGIASLKPLGLPLPLGISFYTFQTMTYTIDIYRNEATYQKSIFSFGAYVCMFPQLIAGPIVRYREIAQQLDYARMSFSQFSYGVETFLVGLSKKVLFANTAGILYESISAIPINETTVLLVWIGKIAFAFQIYFDFCGYSDMAVGLGAMLGFKLPKNFNYPYLSKSIKEFWQRWHMTLGAFFRDYVYIPLGGNRKSTWYTVRNMVIVWLLTGLWHGASWNFVLWGFYFCIILLMEKFIIGGKLQKLPLFFRYIYTWMLILVGWTIFDNLDISQLIIELKVMFCFFNIPMINSLTCFYLRNYIILIIIWIIGSTTLPIRCYRYFKNKYYWLEWFKPLFLMYLLILCIASLGSEAYNPFLYFRF